MIFNKGMLTSTLLKTSTNSWTSLAFFMLEFIPGCTGIYGKGNGTDVFALSCGCISESWYAQPESWTRTETGGTRSKINLPLQSIIALTIPLGFGIVWDGNWLYPCDCNWSRVDAIWLIYLAKLWIVASFLCWYCSIYSLSSCTEVFDWLGPGVELGCWIARVYVELYCSGIPTTSEMLVVVDMPDVMHSHTSNLDHLSTLSCRLSIWDRTYSVAADNAGV